VLAFPYQWQMRKERLKRMFGGLFGGGEKSPGLCPACGALVGIHATRCHECGTSLRFGLAAWSKGLAEFFGGQAPVTTVILIVNVVMFAASLLGTMKAGAGGLSLLWSMDGVTLYRLGESYPGAIWDYHEWYRLVTAMFLHLGFIHIAFNMMVLVDVGPIVEELYGSGRFLFVYVLSGVAGFALSSTFNNLAVGASGAIMGLIGVMIAVTTKRSGIEMKELRSRLISWVVSIFAIGFLHIGGMRIDNWGHFGGLAAGFLLGKFMADRLPAPGAERSRGYMLGWLAGIVVLLSFIFMALHYGDVLPG
jgi:rhomboid protease GluP